MIRLPVALRSVIDAGRRPQGYYFPRGRLRFMRDAWKWERTVRFGPTVPTGRAERVVAIMLSYRRPKNIDAIARSILKCDLIERLIVSNNNPEIRISRCVGVRDPRLVLEDHGSNAGASARFVIARREPGTHYFVLDDDLFLYPAQIAGLLERLFDDPSRPHGIFGQRRKPDRGFEDGIHGRETTVDVLNRAYAFTRGHLEEFFRLLDAIGGRIDGDRLAEGSIDRGDDMLLSFSGARSPLCHYVGALLDCPTQWLPGVAVWRETGFREFRERLFARLTAVKSFA
jgi:hypothetical protein